MNGEGRGPMKLAIYLKMPHGKGKARINVLEKGVGVPRVSHEGEGPLGGWAINAQYIHAP